jgi:hypothetical protein
MLAANLSFPDLLNSENVKNFKLWFKSIENKKSYLTKEDANNISLKKKNP